MTTERLQTVNSVLDETYIRLEAGQAAGAKVWLSGFPVLDKTLAGGFRSGELVLVGGGQGLGKTTFALQVMRNLVATGHTAVYFSFDHDNTTLIERLIAMEAAEIAGLSGVSLKRVREAFEARQRSEPKFERRLAGTEAGVEAVQELREYGRRLHLHRSKSSDTDVEAMKKVIETIREGTRQAPFVVVVDSLEKVRLAGSGLLSEDDRATLVVDRRRPRRRRAHHCSTTESSSSSRTDHRPSRLAPIREHGSGKCSISRSVRPRSIAHVTELFRAAMDHESAAINNDD